ncbi:hypothetical protein ACX80I_16905 [Arthrobacter sp. MDT3-44]
MDDDMGSGDDGGLRPLTGDPQVDRIVAVLDGLDDLPVPKHVDVYLDVHARLSSELNPEQRLRQAGAHGAP